MASVHCIALFKVYYATSDPFRHRTAPPILNVNDFLLFQTHAAGCPLAALIASENFPLR